MRRSLELRQELGEQHDAYKKLLETPQEKRTAEQNAELDRLDVAMDKIEGEIKITEKSEARDQRLGQRLPTEPVKPDVEHRAVQTLDEHRARAVDYEKRFGRMGRYIAERMADNPVASPEYRTAWAKLQAFGKDALAPDELRALSVGTATEGGHTVPLEEFLPRLIKAVDDSAPMRTVSTILPPVTQAQGLGIPTLAADPADADWTTELGTGSEDGTMAFGKREMHPYPMAKRIKVSDKLLRSSPLAMEPLVLDRLGYKFGITGEKAFQTGDGVNKALGIFTPSADGIPTSRDVEIGDGSAAVDPDKVIDARYTLKEGYWPRARWMFHRNWLAKFRKLKSALAQGGNYLWQPGLTAGAPSTFLDFPYTLSEYSPSVTTHGAGVYAAVLGDFSNYWIVDALTTRIQRLVELYAETGQVGFIGRAEMDGQPVLSEAFVRAIAAT